MEIILHHLIILSGTMKSLLGDSVIDAISSDNSPLARHKTTPGPCNRRSKNAHIVIFSGMGKVLLL